MTMPWLKLWNKILDSPKIQMMDGDTFKGWINLLCLANRENKDGLLPDLHSISFALRIKVEETGSLIDEMLRRGLIERHRGTLIIHDWAHWQASTQVTASERSRRYRENKKAKCDVTASASRALASHEAERSAITGEGATRRALEEEGDKEEEGEEEKTPLPPETGGVTKKPKFAPPDWIPRREWDGFVEMRTRIKKPLTDLAMERAVSKLDELRKAGDDPAAVLEQSIFHCWQKLLPLSAGSDRLFDDRRTTPNKPPEEPTKYHVEPADSPYRLDAERKRAKLFTLFGGAPAEGGSPPAAQPGHGEGGPGVVSVG